MSTVTSTNDGSFRPRDDFSNDDETQENVRRPIIQTPIQIPSQSGESNRQRFTNVNTPPNSSNPTFAALRTSSLQVAIGHPLAYVRVLMQIGYEPFAPYKAKNLFGKEVYYYPNVLRYLKHVYTVDGFLGLYRGYGCSLLAKVVSWYTTTKVDEILGADQSRGERDDLTWNKCIKKILREVQCQSFGVLASHPFQVMAIRCMGQFIGRETSYSSINIFKNIREIYDREGIGGFFVGFIPRWLLEISTVILTNVIIHLLKTQIPAQKEVVNLYEHIATFIAQTVTYPLSVVTTVSAINRSGLRAGMLPLTPIYANWQDAYRHLSKTEQLKRGSSLFNRTLVGKTGFPAPGSPIPNA